MEHLNIHDAPPLGAGQGPPMPPPVPQLPPQMFTTAAQLLDLTDSKVAHPKQLYNPGKLTEGSP